MLRNFQKSILEPFPYGQWNERGNEAMEWNTRAEETGLLSTEIKGQTSSEHVCNFLTVMNFRKIVEVLSISLNFSWMWLVNLVSFSFFSFPTTVRVLLACLTLYSDKN